MRSDKLSAERIDEILAILDELKASGMKAEVNRPDFRGGELAPVDQLLSRWSIGAGRKTRWPA